MTDYNGNIVKGSVDETGCLHLVLSRAPVNAANSQFFFELGHYFSLARVGVGFLSCCSSVRMISH